MKMAPKGNDVIVSDRKLEMILSMKGGSGEASYANNSQAQVPFEFLSSYIFTHFLFVISVLCVSP